MSRKFLYLAIAVAILAALSTLTWYSLRTRDVAITAKARLEIALSKVASLEQTVAKMPPPVPISTAWQLVTDDAPWPARDGAFAASFKDYIWLANGWSPTPYTNSIWRSKDGADWEVAVEKAPWANRHLGNFVVLNDRLWMLGGDFTTDIWSSADGITWKQETATAPWGERYNPYIGVFDGKMWLMGGLDRNNEPLRDVWSSPDGRAWTQVQTHAPWVGRGLISGFAAHDDAMWIMGGGTKVVNPAAPVVRAETLVDLSDVWRSSDGVTWEMVNARAAWSPRTHVSVAGFDGHLIVTDGSVGKQSGLSNEAWQSTDGIAWLPVGGEARQLFPPRHASTLVEHEGSLFLIAGYFHNDVWRLDSID